MADIKTDIAANIRSGEELDIQKLNTFLKERLPGIGEIISITQFPGGFSNLTYCLKTADKEFVLRRPPFGAAIKSAHDMGREFKVLSLLKDHYNKIPQPVIYCENEEIIGAPFYIMERINGVILRASNAPKMNLPANVLRKTSEALIDNFVVLHSIDIHSTGLVQLGRPEGYVQRQVEGWTKRYYNAETDKIDTLDSIANWMKDKIPAEQTAAFIHNDYKYDNVVLDTNDLSKIIAVLDWEMATVGDPLMDLGGTLAYWSEAGDTDEVKFFNLTWLPGNLTRQEVIERYAEKSGRDVSNILFYYIFGLYKNAVIAQQIYARWKQGHTKDPRFGALLPIIKGLGVKAQNALNKLSV
ncbi:MAG: aminoglycoside phosphotransferase [Bacteroidota bacterium]|nr:aminoglycoside phosphotransferase [Bacteroidota bacterium]